MRGKKVRLSSFIPVPAKSITGLSVCIEANHSVTPQVKRPSIPVLLFQGIKHRSTKIIRKDAKEKEEGSGCCSKVSQERQGGEYN